MVILHYCAYFIYDLFKVPVMIPKMRTSDPKEFLKNTTFFGKLDIAKTLKDIEKWSPEAGKEISYGKSRLPLVKLDPGNVELDSLFGYEFTI